MSPCPSVRRIPLVGLLLGLLVAALPAANAMPPLPPWQEGQQLLQVLSADWDARNGELRRYVRRGNGWDMVGAPVAVSLGRAGSAWGLGLHPPQPGPRKREGDGRAPAGVFAIGVAFGYADHAATRLDYRPMTPAHHCIDVPASPLYNRIVSVLDVGEDAIAGSTEPMRRDLHLDGDRLYRLGFVIEHNADGVADAGSCIFAHVWRGPDEPTAGCTAMDDAAMEALLAWLDPAMSPRLVLLPRAAHAALQREWDLPPATR